MGRLIDCQIAVAPWGTKAHFRRAKVGLLRKASTIYLAIFSNSATSDNKLNKFPIDKNTLEILPAAIRLKELGKDLFIRQTSDEQRYKIMMREIKIILKRDQLRQGSKASLIEEFISNIPSFDAYYNNPKDFIPPRLSAQINETYQQQQAATSSDGVFGFGGGDGDGIFDDANDNDDDRIKHKRGMELVGTTTTTTTQKHDRQHQQLCNKRLKSIKITGLETLPKQLWHRTTLYELVLTHCNLTSIPNQLESLSLTLAHLDLGNNRINKVPRTFCCKMNNLLVLNLSNNQIETLPIEIKFFSRLVDLNISNNRLRMLPSTFSDLRSLRKLNVAKNNLSQLPAFRTEDIRLRHLDVSDNPLDGALNEANTFEVHSPFYDGTLDYEENLYCPLNPISKKKFPTLFEISMLKIVRCDRLLKLASEESLPRSIVSIMQRDIFKCYRCRQMSILPAYNSTDILDYVGQVERLECSANFSHRMTFMKLLCRTCFDNMSS